MYWWKSFSRPDAGVLFGGLHEQTPYALACVSESHVHAILFQAIEKFLDALAQNNSIKV